MLEDVVMALITALGAGVLIWTFLATERHAEKIKELEKAVEVLRRMT